MLCLVMLVLSITLVGCNKKIDIKDSFSEITKLYFHAEDEDKSCTISVGQREDVYIIDGKHTKNVDFSLITLKFNKIIEQNQIEVDFIINDETKHVLLELNPGNQCYMADLGYALNQNDVINLVFENKSLNLVNLSNSFYIDYESAIEIAVKDLGEDLNTFYSNGNFNGECYLKVLTLKNRGEEGLFWIFSAVSENRESKNIIINIDDGSILVKN